jgi:erythromycin esterase
VDGIAPDLRSTDLEPLRPWIGTATVVALGESIHTSGGYHTAKHRVFRFLVERAGFRAAAFQTPWAAAERISSYVSTCKGSPEEALQGLDSVWQSAEVLDFVQWMCQWNRTHRKPKDRLTFLGFDIQQPESDGPALLAFLQRIKVPADHPWIAGVNRCNGVAGPRAAPGQVPAEDNTACLEALDGITDKFIREAAAIIRRTSKKDFEWAKVRLTGLRSWQGYSFYIRSDSVRSDESRDSGMASVLRSLQTLRLPPKTKVVLWAHNFHASRAPLDDPNGFARTMGTFLAESLGASYFVVGLVGWDVKIDPGTPCFPSRTPPIDSVEGRLHNLGEAYLLVDPRVSSSVLTAGEPSLVSGSNVVPGDHYNALLFLDTSPKMTPLFRPPCP